MSEQRSEVRDRSSDDDQRVPAAVIVPQRRLSWIWILPALALLVTVWLGWQAWATRGISIAVQLDDGYGLKAGDDVRYRGISVGRIDAVTLAHDLQGVIVSARLKHDAEHLARAGTQYWVVRPQLRLTRVEGLETLIGPRYLAALPSQPGGNPAPPQRYFVGLPQPPVLESVQPGDLEIVLQAAHRGSLHPGAPVTYRQTRIGTILSVGLSSDGGSVEARAHIQQPFVQLVRPNTRFWDVGGIQAKIGLSGVSVEIESAEALLSGGVALATPPASPGGSAGDAVRTGHRFVVASKPESEWLQWQPMIALGGVGGRGSLLPLGVLPPSPLRASIGWKQGRWIRGERQVHGWVLQTTDGLLGPADLLKPGDRADPDTVVLEVAGAIVPLNGSPAWEQNGLAMLGEKVAGPQWPASQIRIADKPEEALAIADGAEPPLPLAASRLTSQDGRWLIDPAISINDRWHGASVVARNDGKLLGLLLVSNGRGSIALLPQR